MWHRWHQRWQLAQRPLKREFALSEAGVLVAVFLLTTPSLAVALQWALNFAGVVPNPDACGPTNDPHALHIFQLVAIAMGVAWSFASAVMARFLLVAGLLQMGRLESGEVWTLLTLRYPERWRAPTKAVTPAVSLDSSRRESN